MVRILPLGLFLASIVAASLAHAQEFPPAAGKGRAVIVDSGKLGASAYEPAAKRIAGMGYDVFLLNSADMIGDRGAGLKAAIDKAQQSPHALPGKVGMVGFSLGGGQVLGYTSPWADQVAVVVVMYPLTSLYKDIPGLVGRIKVPVLMLAGDADTYENCCRIETARAIAAAARDQHAPLELVEYAGANHDFIIEGMMTYKAKAAADAWARTEAKLKEFLSEPSTSP